jgi:hypothetical protein
MPVSALLITTRTPETSTLRTELERHPSFLLAPESQPGRVGVVLDTPDEDANRSACRWLRQHSEVAHVDVLTVHLDSPRS